MIYSVRRTSQFKDDIKKCIKRNLDLNSLKIVLSYLVNGECLPTQYKDHPLQNSRNFKNCWELHIEPDWLLVYKYSLKSEILYLIRTGTHSDLFK